eukprot:4270580-Alexandrium_andersonii.AAC.1
MWNLSTSAKAACHTGGRRQMFSGCRLAEGTARSFLVPVLCPWGTMRISTASVWAACYDP